ncbi:HotDog domain-containing protein [Podospora aff. communis PSN243]|uniref:HotDog domain-containing protein n=1 Tax=Podospora aff. communis PSN243 TaxID=3040156 RepID=A0AAV9GTW3_9PEZI|nr:HotDog domain-containing protein [Podospora aff. communis PSN243]
MATTANPTPGVGFEYPPAEVTWLKRDVLLFARSIGATKEELHFLYELHPDFSVFPTYPVILPFKTNTQEVIDFYAAQKAVQIPGVPAFDATRAVDGQRLIQFLKPLPPTSEGKKFEARTKVIGVWDKGRPGTVVETETNLVEVATGEVYSRVIGSAFYVGQGGWSGPKGPATVNYPPPKGKKPDVVFEETTSAETALLYRLNGDYNPLHATPEPGKKMGFGGVIIHGLYSFNWACHGLLKALGASDPANIKEYQARFASPVRPGDKLVTSVWRDSARTGEIQDGWEDIRFEVKVEGGKVCLSNGRALMKDLIGQRRSYDGALCTVRYSGEVAGTTGLWLGVEWDDPSRGKHDGQHKGVRYFSCKSKSPTAASFVRPTRPADARQTFVSALNLKYASDAAKADDSTPKKQIIISGKVAEEVGFDKIRRQQAQLAELKNVFLDGTQIAYASPPPDQAGSEQSISQVCPKVTELDLSRNLFDRLGTVVDICSELKSLQVLRVKGNRFQNILEDEKLESAESVFKNIRELAIDETLMSWPEICHVASKFPTLYSLFSSANQLSSLSLIPTAPLISTLVSVHMEFNEFTSIADIAPLSAITSLRNIHLKGNHIASINSASSPTAPVFTKNLAYLDVSYNQISSWSFIDALPASFPGLTSLRFAHNPVYDNPDLESSTTTSVTAFKASSSNEEAYMLLLARLPPTMKTINFSTITPADRSNAEMFYLSRIARQVSAAPESEEASILSSHRRWGELCEAYGEPAIIRRREMNPNFLDARLIGVEFYLASGAGGEGMVTKKTQIPKAFDIYAVKGIVGRLFGVEPLGVRLIWETGEWDPVGGFDEVEEEEEDVDGDEGVEGEIHEGGKAGRWVKRETELRDGPRQFGYYVDGLEVKIRVEVV